MTSLDYSTYPNKGKPISENPTIYSWQQALDADINQLGGKGWHLAQLNRYGFAVPPGGVVPVNVYTQFIQDNSLQQDFDNISQQITMTNVLDQATEKQLEIIRSKIQQGNFADNVIKQLQAFLRQTDLVDQALAVRSSATAEDSSRASFAGIHESFLNVTGLDAVIGKVKACYASLWTTQAVAYRRKMGFSDAEVLPAVIIMQLINADAAGVAFSCDPSNGREDGYLISANFGLGESVVNGSVEPDSYFMDNRTFTTTNISLGKKALKTVRLDAGGTREIPQSAVTHRVLDADQRTRLALLIQRIYDCMGKSEQHQDIEWVLQNNAFYIVQARPVTALPHYTVAEMQDKKTVWSNANYRDGIPMVQTAMQRHTLSHTINNIVLIPFRMIGYDLPPGLSINQLFNGRAYFNLGQYQWILYDALGSLPEDVNLMAGGHQPKIEISSDSPFKGKKGLQRITRLIKHIRLMNKYTRQRQTYYDRCNRFCAQIENANLEQLTNEQLLQRDRELVERYTDFGPIYMILNSNLGPLLMATKALNKHFPGQGLSLVNALMAGRGNITSADHGYQLQQLANLVKTDSDAGKYFEKADFVDHNWKQLPETSAFKKAFSEYLSQYGHRGNLELDITRPRWREDPTSLLQHIHSFIQMQIPNANANTKEQQQLVYQQAMETLKTKLGSIRRYFILNMIHKGSKGSEIREWSKSILVRMCSAERLLLLESGRRLQQRDILDKQEDIFHCSPAEIQSLFNHYWDGKTMKLLVNERKQQMLEWEQISPPDLIEDNKSIYAKASLAEDGKSISGIAVSAGEAQGPVRKLTSPDQAEALNNNDILVAPATDPSWTPLFLKASAIVLETGGYTSHGSIVAREYGIPAVVNVAGVMTWLNDNETVIVNGYKGRLYKTD